jgi:predicted nuclease of predicted toxin-antitoxin system
VTGLFVRLYLDEDVSVLIKQLLASRGFDVLTAQEAGSLGAADAEQLAFATAHDRAIVTHNHGDFEALAADYLASSRHHAGIIIAYRRRPNEIAQRLIAILDDVTADEMRNQVRYI